MRTQRLNAQGLALLAAVASLMACSSPRPQPYNVSDPEQSRIARAATMAAYQRGKEIWFSPTIGTNGRTCESCHPGGEMTRAEAYPRYKHVLRGVATLSMTHNFAVVNESRGQPWELGSDDANAIALFVTSLANGKKVNISTPSGIEKEWAARGSTHFADPSLGTTGKSCLSCHNIRDNVSRDPNTGAPGLKGVTAYYPKYSFRHGRVVTVEQQVNYCLEHHMGAVPWPLDSKAMVELVAYLAALSEGTKVRVAVFDQ
ncbi:MAG: hypothetical protein ONB14_07530 [candidate division KSB1 bacterium]|nr:hypothetical protein [candidate division KSB1 bacterium]